MLRKKIAVLMALMTISLNVPLESVSAMDFGDVSGDFDIKKVPAPQIYNDYLENPDKYLVKPSSVNNEDNAPVDVSENLPESFDLRSEGLVSSVKNQGNYGTCWAQCAAASMETSLIAQNPFIDISEWQLAYFGMVSSHESDYSYGSAADDSSSDTDFYKLFEPGGSQSLIINNAIHWGGVSDEEKFPYGFEGIANEDYRYDSDYHVSDIYRSVENLTASENVNSQVKELVYDGISVTLSFLSYDGFYNSETGAYFGDSTVTTEDNVWASSHAVAIVGWDDNYSKENFREDMRPENDGAWLVKNSWGSDFGNNGFCWISYEDNYASFDAAYSLEYADNYDKLYENDKGLANPWDYYISQNTKEGYISNIFTAEENEYISAAAFFTNDNGTEYEITVYTDLQDETNPASGTEHKITSGTEKYAGYHTYDFPEAVYVEKGQKYSVAVKLANPEKNFIATASSLPTLDNADDYQKFRNLSFVSLDGKTWSDSSEENENDVSVGIINLRAFANSADKIEFSDYAPYVENGEKISLSADSGNDIYFSYDGNIWELYGEPIEITDSDTTIYASLSQDGSDAVSHTYSPQTAVLSSLSVYNSDGYVKDITISSGSKAVTDINESITGNMSEGLAVIPTAPEGTTININGKVVESGERYSFSMGSEPSLEIIVSAENKKSTVYNVNYEAQYVDYINEMVIFPESDVKITAPDGTELESWQSISDYIGQTLEAEYKDGSGKFEIVLPQRPAKPENVTYTIDYDKMSIKFNQDISYSFSGDDSGSCYETYQKEGYIPIDRVNGQIMYCRTPATENTFKSEAAEFKLDELADAPEAEIVVKSIADNSISVEPIDGVEYGIAQVYSEGYNYEYEWSSSPVFENLFPATSYSVAVRYPSKDGKPFSKLKAVSVETTGVELVTDIRYLTGKIMVITDDKVSIADSEGNIINYDADTDTYLEQVDILQYKGQQLTVTNITQNYSYKLQIPDSPGFVSEVSVDYKNEQLNINTNGKSVYYSVDNCETWELVENSDSVDSLTTFLPTIGDYVYFKNGCTDKSFESEIYAMFIPQRREADFKVELDKSGSTSFSIKPIENAEYTIMPFEGMGSFIYTENTEFTDLEPDTYYRLDIRLKADDSNFASMSKSVTVKTPADSKSAVKLYAQQGDLDGDGEVTSYDALLVLQYVSGESSIDDEILLMADNDLSQEITSYDALLALQYVAGLVDNLPVVGESGQL
ncbi:MAG TPA: hypothetical protein DIW26_06125 [Ruminococcus sp.]|nr:hypothetical protein [Ruminococcus sp.]